MDAREQGRVGFGRGYGGPGKYIQRAGEIERLPDHVKPLGDKAFLLVDGFVLNSMGGALRASFERSGLAHTVERFNGECSSEEIARVEALVRKQSAGVVIGIGGGKTADTAKVAACATGARIVIVPTIASTDAPCSAIAVRYTPNGVYQESMFLPRNPDIVLVDSAVIVKAPPRFLVAGMGDALSTWFEARSNVETNSSKLYRLGLPGARRGPRAREGLLRRPPARRARRQIRRRTRRADAGGREHHRGEHAAQRPRLRELRRVGRPRDP